MTRGIPGGYPPEFRTLVHVAFKEERFIPCPDKNTAIAMRHRLNNYRVFLRRNPEYDPETLQMIEQVEFGLRPLATEEKAYRKFGAPLPQAGIICKPRGGQFADLITAAGIQEELTTTPNPEATIAPVEVPVMATTAEAESMDAALAAFMRQQMEE